MKLFGDSVSLWYILFGDTLGNLKLYRVSHWKAFSYWLYNSAAYGGIYLITLLVSWFNHQLHSFFHQIKKKNLHGKIQTFPNPEKGSRTFFSFLKLLSAYESQHYSPSHIFMWLNSTFVREKREGTRTLLTVQNLNKS